MTWNEKVKAQIWCKLHKSQAASETMNVAMKLMTISG